MALTNVSNICATQCCRLSSTQGLKYCPLYLLVKNNTEKPLSGNCMALHCIALHCIALHFSVLHFRVLHFSVLHFRVLHFSVLHYCIVMENNIEHLTKEIVEHLTSNLRCLLAALPRQGKKYPSYL